MTVHSAHNHASAIPSSLITRHAGGFTILYSMLHLYFFHLYALLLQLTTIGGEKQVKLAT
jgi:hypothetical protein